MNGVLYIVFGTKYIEQAINSAHSLKKHSHVDISIFCDKSPNNDVFDDVRIINPDHKRCKVDFISQSKYDNTLYIDSDTSIRRDISDIFDLFERFDLCATHDHARKSSRWHSIVEYEKIPYAFPEYNGGVIGYKKNEKTKEFFKIWKDTFYENKERTNGQDQASLRIALWKSDLRIATLPAEYNIRSESIRKKIMKRSKNKSDESLLKPRIYHWYGAEKNKISFLRKKIKPMKI